MIFNRELLHDRTVIKVEILTLIRDQPNSWTQSALAQEFNCSRKLINTYLTEINQLAQTWLDQTLIQRHSTLHQLVIAGPHQHLNSLLIRAHLLAADSNVQLLLLLMQSTKLTTLEICHQLYISESCLHKKMALLRNHLAPYALSIKKRTGHYRLSGNAFQLMAYFLEFFRTGFNYQIWPFTNSSQTVVTASLRLFFEGEKIHLTKTQLTHYSFLVGLLRCQPMHIKETTERALSTENKTVNQQLLNCFKPSRLTLLVAQLNLSPTDLNLFLCYSQTRDDFYLIKQFNHVALNQHQIVDSDEHQLIDLFKAQILPLFTVQGLTADTQALPSLLAINYAFILAKRFQVAFPLLTKHHVQSPVATSNPIQQISQTIHTFIHFEKNRPTHLLMEQLATRYHELLTHFFKLEKPTPCFKVSLFGYDSHHDYHVVQALIEQRFKSLFSFTFVANPHREQPADLLFFNPHHGPPANHHSPIPVTSQVTFQDCQRIHDALIQSPQGH